MSVDQLSKLPGNAVTVRGLSPELKARLRVPHVVLLLGARTPELASNCGWALRPTWWPK